MHKGIILLVKAETKEQTLEQVKEFMEEYKNDVWDWYQIGGRWTCVLSPLCKIFLDKIKSLNILNTREDDFLSQQEIDEKQSELQAVWEDIGAMGQNPYCNHYNLPREGGYYDIMKLSDCIEKVKEWQQTVEHAKKEEQEAKRWLADGGNIRHDTNESYDDWNMYGYSLNTAANLYQQNFCFDCNIFNIERYNYSIPEDIENYHALMMDIHN
jgi:hypothetical protein